DSDSAAAVAALAALERATDLPLAARASYRFREARTPATRAAWNARMGAADLEDLRAAAGVFDQLTRDDPQDAAAWYNQALCLAWAGENHEAIGCLDRVVALEATSAFDDAVAAWTLAEVLRQGAGAEPLSDEMRFACILAWDPGNTSDLLREFPEIRKLP